MLISAREASRLLRDAGLTRERSRRLLASGIAGRPVAAGGAHLYDAELIRDLVARPAMGSDEVVELCPAGLFVARRDIDATDPDQQLEALRGGWGLSLPTVVWLRILIEHHDYFPLVATVCGYVVTGAEIVFVTLDGTRRKPESVLNLRPAGDWFETFSGRRLPTGPGRPWTILGWDWRGPPRDWRTRQP